MARHEASGVSGKRLQLSANRAKGLRRLPSGSWSALQTHESRFVVPSLWTSAGKASGLERGLSNIRNQSMRDRHGGMRFPVAGEATELSCADSTHSIGANQGGAAMPLLLIRTDMKWC